MVTNLAQAANGRFRKALVKVRTAGGDGRTSGAQLTSCNGQAVIEMTFSMIIVVILSLATIRFFFWVFDDINTRRRVHHDVLMSYTRGNVNECKIDGSGDTENAGCVALMVRPKFFEYYPPKAEIAK